MRRIVKNSLTGRQPTWFQKMLNDLTSPSPGEVYWLELPSGHGHEQHGRRPVLIVTDARLGSLGLTWVVPLTTTSRGWPVHVKVHVAGRVTEAMCEQIRSVSVDRLGRLVGTVTHEELREIRALLREIIGN